MEPASSAQGMSLPEILRPKQREIIEAFATETEVIAKLPTGYGKTLAAAGSYAMLRHRMICNRMLYIVPRAGQANQAGESVPLELAQFGIKSRAVEVSRSQMEALRRHRESSVEIFVTTIQALQSSPVTSRTIEDLMQTGRWFVVIDEHHHYGENGAWTDRIKALPWCARLIMSATPDRLDKSDYFSPPTITETYIDAAKAGYVKNLRLHAYHYVIDAVTIDGHLTTFTTEEFIEEVGSDSPEEIEKHMLARKMRWSPKYISPLILCPVERLIDLRAKGIRSQMLVQAMSCSHAAMVCKQARALLGENFKVDWVGTGPSGRTDRENEAVLRAFCPPKDQLKKNRPWTLDVLVNVGMAGEGLDTTDVTEIVFLTHTNVTISNLQIIGRASRTLLRHRQVPAHINVDTSSPMQEYVGEQVMKVFDDLKPEKPKDRDPRGPDEYEPLPETMQVWIADMRLDEIRKGLYWEVALAAVQAEASPITPHEDMVRAAETAIRNLMSQGDNISSGMAQMRDQIGNATPKVVGLIIRRYSDTGLRIEQSLAGDLIKRINSRKSQLYGSVKTASEADLQLHWKWLLELERQILTSHGLDGLPLWLR